MQLDTSPHLQSEMWRPNFIQLPSFAFASFPTAVPGAQPDVMGKFANVNSSRSTTEDANEFIIRPLLELGLSLLKTSDICSSALAGSYIKGQSSTIETASTAGIWSVFNPSRRKCCAHTLFLITTYLACWEKGCQNTRVALWLVAWHNWS